MIPLSRGSFDVIVGMDQLSKRNFGIVCHGKVVRIPLEGDEILRVHGERTQGVVKTLMNTKVGESKLSVPGATPVAKSPYHLAPLEMQELSEQLLELQDKELELLRKEKLYAKSSVKDKILATSSEASKVENAPAEMLCDLDQQMEKREDDSKANVVIEALSRKERVKPRRVRAMAMTIQYGVRGMILTAQSEAFKQENAEIGESSLTRPELVLDITDKVVLIKEKLKAARDRQKSYADNRHKPLEFEYRGVILERIGPVVYRLRLPKELSGVHDTFHVSNLKKCLADASLHVPLDEIKVDKTLCFVEEPVENSDREVNRFGNQSIERDRLIGIGFVLDFVEFISFTFGDKEMILWFKRFSDLSVRKGLNKIIREVFVKLLLDSFGKLSISYAFSVSLLLTPLCCDDIHDVTPRVSALAGCDILLRRALHLKDAKGTYCLPTATIFAELEKMGAKTTAWNEFSSTMASTIILFLDKQVEVMSKHKDIYVTPSHTKKVFANMKREGKGFSGRVTPLFQTMMVQAPKEVDPITDEATIEEHVSTPSYDPTQSGKDRMQLNELMDLCAKLFDRVLALENTNNSQAAEIATLKERVKKLERKRRSRTYKPRRVYKVSLSRRIKSSDDASLGAQEDASKQGRKIADIDQDARVTLIDETQGRSDDNLMFDTATIIDELTLAQTLMKIKAVKPKAVTTATTTTTNTRPNARGVVVQDPSEFKTTTSPLQASQLPHAKDKGKEKMVEPEIPLKKKDQIAFDEEVARNLAAQLQAELEEEVRLSRQKEEESNIALIES
ncbi:hypothetical protein Tco_0563983 [Tanacetum coccineum]